MAKKSDTVETNEKSALAKLHETWLSNGGKAADKKSVAAFKAELKAADEAYARASAALEAAQAARTEVATRVILAMGAKQDLDLGDGIRVAPSCRGTSVFFRRVTERAVV